MDISEVKKNLNKLVIYQPTKESKAIDYYLTGCILRRNKETKRYSIKQKSKIQMQTAL